MLISHPAENNIPAKMLTEHLQNVAELSKSSIVNQSINPTIINKQKLERLSLLIGLFHDFGKATTWFQSYIMGEAKSSLFTRHSLISAVVGYYATLEEFNSNWAYLVFQIILKHHSNLRSYEIDASELNFAPVQKQIENIIKNAKKELELFYQKYEINLNFISKIDLEEFEEIIEESEDIIEELSEKSDDDSFEFFFLNNYLFSLLIDFDKQDAARLDNSYFEGNLIEDENNVFSYIEECRKNEPEKFSSKTPINQSRNKFLKEIKENENIKPENHFYSITAPTGIGKTFGCMVFANKLKNQLPNKSARIVYALPYTSIIDQNFIEFEKIVSFNKKVKYAERPNRYLMKHHYLSPKIIEKRIDIEENKKTLKDYLDDRLFVESWQSAMVVTTFVQLLHTIFGYKNRFLKKFHNIINSIIILDEVQNIDPSYHLLIQKAFKVLGNIFNTYFLQVTATQPNIFEKESLIEIVNSEYYMKNEIFNRVKLDINFEPQELDDFANNFCDLFSDNNCLIVVNTKKYATKLFYTIQENLSGYHHFCLTTNLTPFHRNQKIKKIKELLNNHKKVIVVSTQLIEAGVDLSFKNVYRDFGPIDSIIQVSGRCNRNGELGKLGGNFYLINLSNNKIYSKSLMQYTEEILNEEQYTSSDFITLSNDYFGKFSFNLKSKMIIRAIKEMNYDRKIKNQIPVSDFKLIPEDIRKNVFILHTEEAESQMRKLIKLKQNLKFINISDEKNDIIIEIEKLKHKLIGFQVSVYPQELNVYNDLLEPEEELNNDKDFPYIYISYENQKKYAYDENVGFLKEPKTQIPGALFF